MNRDRISYLENIVNTLLAKVDELSGHPDDVEVFKIVEVTIEEAKTQILKTLKKGKEPKYISDIIEETHMDPENVYIAYEQLIEEGKIKKS